MFNRFASTAAFSLTLAAVVAVFGAVSASAQTTNTTGSSGYDMLNAQSATPSAGVSGYTNTTYPYSGTTNSSSSMNSNSTVIGATTNSTTNGSTGTTSRTTGTRSSTSTTNGSTTPGVPNTGAGGDAPINLAVLIISGLIVAAGMTYVTLRLAL